jgi:two-component system response regulator VicR
MARILVVDDEAEIANALRRLLRRRGFEVETATSGLEGLTKAAAFQPDLVLSDFRMPGMTGAEMLGRIKRLYPLTLRAILSGYADLNSVIAAVNEGEICRFFSKPWDDASLVAVVEGMLRERDILVALHRPFSGMGSRFQVEVGQHKSSVQVCIESGPEPEAAAQAVSLIASFVGVLGMDLETVSGLLEKHQGRVSLVVEVGKGKRLTLELPRMASADGSCGVAHG